MAKSSWLQKARVRMKLLVPVGVALSPSETVTLAGIYEDDVKVLENNGSEIRTAIAATESGIRTSNSLSAARAARSQAAGTFKITKDPIKKREWARRLIVADQTIQSIRNAQVRLTATKDRLTMIKGDMELQLMEAEARAAEMNAYAKAGNSLRLAGEKLMQARSRANKLNIEYDNLEVTMEGAEKLSSKLSDQELLAKAKDIISRAKDDE